MKPEVMTLLNINPLLLVGGGIGAVTALLIFAYASVKDKKTAMGFERTMADGEILRRLSEGGNTVVVIEHNLDVIKTADYIIDMGPEGGAGGGNVVAAGTPEEICEVEESYTGQYLKGILER